ncbi:MAG: site-specific DNA-methyltransferase [Candidatus Pacebacteria bacterium]|nr:site-specific DNA-methyltransferase [Candidatus Paceibacterota bacterium]
MAKNKKLELTWFNKDKSLFYDLEDKKYIWVDKKDPRVSEPRILLEKASYGDKNSENMLIKGDNLLALKALESDFRNTFKLIFLDPPYNTGSAFEQYNDGLEHSIWLGMMKTRLESLYKLLSTSGSLWITVDDNESHYLKVLCDEIFGRKNFVANIIWQKKYTRSNDAKWFSDNHDHILIFAKNKDSWKLNKLPRTEEMDKRYKNPDNDPRGPWMTQPLHAKSGTDKSYSFTFENNIVWKPPSGTFPRYSKNTLEEADRDGRIWFGKTGSAVPRMKKYLADMNKGVVPMTIWTYGEVGSNDDAKREVKQVNPKDVFSTPKPEKLMHRIIQMATAENDWVLDSFAGSGTTGAVAHKMNRRWVMIEMENHAETHIVPRMKRIVDGKDKNKTSKLVKWSKGGGFSYLQLGDSLFVQDDDLKLTILNQKMYNGPLIRAVLKVEGFKLKNPDNGIHGIAGKTIAHVTEQYISQQYIDVLIDEIGSAGDFIIVYAKTISSSLELPDNVEVRRIPDVLLRRFKV